MEDGSADGIVDSAFVCVSPWMSPLPIFRLGSVADLRVISACEVLVSSIGVAEMFPADTFLGTDMVSNLGSGVSGPNRNCLLDCELVSPIPPVDDRPLAPNGIGGFRSRPIGIALPIISRAFFNFCSLSISSETETVSVLAHN